VVQRSLGRTLAIAVALFALTTLTLGSNRIAAAACLTDADCDDGLACTGIETCNPDTAECEAGTPVDCSSAGDQCNDGVCQEPSGTCGTTPKIDGFGCDDGSRCTLNDTCQAGVCMGAAGADTDNDGWCDYEEIQAGCNPDDFFEIPAQANVFTGSASPGRGEVLLTFYAPSARNISSITDPTCATAGVCNSSTGFCIVGKVADPCAVDSDCNQTPPAGFTQCRIVANYAGTPDYTLVVAKLKLRKKRKGDDILLKFSPATPGCSRKVDIALPAGFKLAGVRVRVKGTTGVKRRNDRDKILYREK